MSVDDGARNCRNADDSGSPFQDDDETDNDLLSSVQQQIRAGIQKLVPGSPAARDWKRFCQIYTGTIRRTAKACGLPPDETEDLEHETWVQVMRKLPDYRPSGRPGSFRRWLHTIVRHKAIDLLRRKKRHPTRSLAMVFDDAEQPIDPGPDPADAYERCWTRELVSSVLDILRVTDPDTRLLEMRVLEGQSIQQIAVASARPPQHVRTRIHRVTKRLGKAVEYFLGEGGKK